MFPIPSAALISAPPPGKLQMWWRDSDKPNFSESTTRQSIARVFQAAAGIETELWNALFAPRIVRRTAEGVAVQMAPNADSLLVVTFSKEKGVRLHFDPATTSPQVRDDAWLQFAVFSEALRTQLSRSLWFRLRQRFLSTDALAWWRNMEQVVASLESAGDPPQAVGTILVGAV